MLRLLVGGVSPVGAGFTDNVLAQTNNLTKPALLGEQGKIGKIGELILALDRGGRELHLGKVRNHNSETRPYIKLDITLYFQPGEMST
ncbi:hypothetical protein [Coleofasciculus sp. G2-EDA-02]|uniref:hypothetical protein n=1 Tax=Coleofasciculus sp. G2-EDA-02 TaxID=3069529 RepID=UPI0032F2144A